MCGITGILAFNDAFPLDEATVTRMSDTLCHRGPDDAGVIVRRDERVALGHRRLSTVSYTHLTLPTTPYV